MEEYRYKVSDFEGPLDLLLYLIEKNKVDIYHIPVAEIADQFNEYVAQIDFFDVNYGSKFFLMAATLLQIRTPFAYEPKFSGTLEKEALFRAFQTICKVVADKEAAAKPVRIEREIYSVDECMNRVVDYLQEVGDPAAVTAVFSRCESRLELVITFLAVLELLKTGRCRTVSAGEEGNALALQYIR